MGYSVIQIPQGQIIKVWQENQFAFYGIVDGNVRLSASSKFSSLLSGKGDSQSGVGKIIDTISTSLGGSGFSTVFPQMAARTWDSTDPISLSLDITYIQGLWGMTGPAIVANVKKIMALSLPKKGGVGESLIPPGPTIATIWADPTKDDKENKIEDTSPAALDRMSAEQKRQKQLLDAQQFSDAVSGSEADIANGIRGFRYKRGRAINIQIGNYLRLDNIVVESSNPEFSDVCDAAGFPVWAKVSLEVGTIMSGTVEMLGVTLEQS